MGNWGQNWKKKLLLSGFWAHLVVYADINLMNLMMDLEQLAVWPEVWKQSCCWLDIVHVINAVLGVTDSDKEVDHNTKQDREL